MTYPGNQSLPSDVQQRIRSTFEHTLGLAEKGSNQEALLGCDFVLRMDPLFEPARRLQERLESAQGPVAVDDLRRLDAASPFQAPPPPSSAAAIPMTAASSKPPAPAHTALQQPPESFWGDLDGLASELPELPEPHQAGLRAEFEALLGERRFQELQGRARQETTTVTGDLELQRLVSLAQERLEAGPYVSKFLLSAREALRAGRPADSQRLVEKARALDPTHPGIAELSSPPAQPPTEAFAVPSPAGPGSFGVGGERSLAAAPEMQTQPISRVAAAPAFAPHEAPLPSAGAADSESERRIEQLLAEGQKALDAGDPQAAIDAWSRIFLIDIDHQEAARRIESARRMKAERDRQVEETFHDGLARLEANDPDGARRAFQHVLELQPGHLPSREYLQQLDDGRPPAAIAGRRPGGKTSAPPPPITGADALAPPAANVTAPGALPAPPILPLPPHLAAGAADLPPDAELKEEILVPPDVGAGAPAPAARTAATREAGTPGAARHEGGARRMFLVVGSAVLLLVVAVGWFLYQKREQWFPNSRTEEPAQAPGPNPIPRAVKLHDAGRATIALTQLRHVPPGDPHYKEAQALIAKWQEEQAQGTSGAAGAAGTPPAGAGAAAGQGTPVKPEVERRAALIEEARSAYQQGTYLLAAERFEAADRLSKLDDGDAAQLSQAKQRLVPLQRQVAMFRGHDWEYALPDLWRLHESDPANRDVTRMLVDCYYNLGVRDLQHTDPGKAGEKFKEARKLAPDDAGVNRQLLFAQTYLERPTDLLYRIYVKYLPIR